MVLLEAAGSRRHGEPRLPDDLDGHEMVGFASSRAGAVLLLESTLGGGTREYSLPVRVSATSADSCAALAQLGFELVQLPLIRFVDALRTAAMVEVLRAYRPPPPAGLASLSAHPDRAGAASRVHRLA